MSSRATAPDDASEGTVRGRRRRGSTVVFAVAAAAVVLIAGGREYGHTLLWGYDEDAVAPITTTAAPKGEKPSLRLAVVGDVGTGDGYEWATAGRVAEAASAGPFDGLILLGDNAYPDGDPERLADTVFDPFGPVIDAGAALLAVLGNHDVAGPGNAEGQVDALGLPGRWYATDLGGTLFVGLDSTQVGNARQLAWLESTLAGSDAATVIVGMHHPAYSAGRHGSTDAVQDLWVPLFRRYGVDLVLAGHDHDYQRSRPIDGVTYIVTGAAAKIRPTGSDEFTAYSASVRHFLEISVWDGRLSVTAHNADGPFDHVEIATEGHPAAVGG